MIADIIPYIPDAAVVFVTATIIESVDESIEEAFAANDIEEAKDLIAHRRHLFEQMTGISPEQFIALYEAR